MASKFSLKIVALILAGSTRRPPAKKTIRPVLERFPIRWNHLIEKESLKFNELEHVPIEKVAQLFRNML